MRLAFRRLLVQCWIALALTAPGCERKDTAPTRASPSATVLTESDRVALMERHYFAVIEAHDAVIRGDFGTARRRLLDLSAQSLPERAPADWHAPHRRMSEQAAAAESIEDLPGAATRVATVVAACGACHRGLGRTPFAREAEEPSEDATVRGGMRRHQWATERLWEGVAGPIDSAWRRGAVAIAEGSVFASDAGTLSPDLRQQQDALRSLGKSATAASDAERPVLYGKMLATCAACHRLVGISPRARAPH